MARWLSGIWEAKTWKIISETLREAFGVFAWQLRSLELIELVCVHICQLKKLRFKQCIQWQQQNLSVIKADFGYIKEVYIVLLLEQYLNFGLKLQILLF